MDDDSYEITMQTGRTIAELRRRVIGQSRPQLPIRGRKPSPDIEYEGMIQTFSAPANGWSTPTTGLINLYMVDPSSTTTPPAMIANPFLPQITFVNRDPTLENLLFPRYGRVRFINGEWKIVYIACGY